MFERDFHWGNFTVQLGQFVAILKEFWKKLKPKNIVARTNLTRKTTLSSTWNQRYKRTVISSDEMYQNVLKKF